MECVHNHRNQMPVFIDKADEKILIFLYINPHIVYRPLYDCLNPKPIIDAMRPFFYYFVIAFLLRNQLVTVSPPYHYGT
jgi:hypothetical protein